MVSYGEVRRGDEVIRDEWRRGKEGEDQVRGKLMRREERRDVVIRDE